ncbi:hypothetical protein DSO57_1027650 [Entomophthora muscae]|uniref:Uncharacterized protein n=1 Tax=Entomophthora muscae TaxID=34485 RepID=A0ACC2TCZ6_9FUNG|nr:hypothetical protein DSO57_1027650 [Entomophthora muscae]
MACGLMDYEIQEPHCYDGTLDQLGSETSGVNAAIHHVSILPSMVYFEDKYLSCAFAPQNESMSELFPDSVQLTCLTHACGE